MNKETFLSTNRSLCLGLFVLAASFGTFMGGLWAILGIGGALIFFCTTLRVEHRCPQPVRDLGILVIATLATMAVLNTQSFSPATSWKETFRLATIFIPLMLWSSPSIQDSCTHPRFFKATLGAAAIGALALGIELSLGGPLLKWIKGPEAHLTEYNRGLSYLVLLAFPLCAGIRNTEQTVPDKKRWLLVAGIFICALLFTTGLTESRASKLALMTGLLVSLAAYGLPRLTQRVLTFVPLILVSWPLLAQKFFSTHYDLLKHFPDSWRDRMEIWDYMSYRIMEHPWLGWGLGTSHLLPFDQPHGLLYLFTVRPASHPHNVMIELWVELGLPGLVLGLIFAHRMLRKAILLPEALRPFALGAFAAALCLSLVAYDFWTDSLWAAFALTGFSFACGAKASDKQGGN